MANNSQPPEQSSKPTRATWNGCRRWASWVIAIVAILVLFIPRILTIPTVLNGVVGWALAQQPFSVQIGSADLGWFRSAVLNDVQVFDSASETLARIPSITTSVTLLQLIFEPNQLGKLQLVEPSVMVRLRRGGSNIEDLLHTSTDEEAPPHSGSPVGGTILVRNGSVVIDAEDNQELARATIRDLNLRFALDAKREPIQVEGVAIVDATNGNQQNERGTSGRFSAAFDWRDSGSADQVPALVDVKLHEFPVEFGNLVAHRFEAEVKLEGALNGFLSTNTHGDQTPQQLQLEGELSLRAFALQHEDWNAETLRLPTAELQLQALMTDDQIHVSMCKLVCPVGATQFQLTGPNPISEVETADRALDVADYQFVTEGRVSLAKLAEQVPQFMRLRNDVQLIDGTLEWNLQQTLDGQPIANANASRSKSSQLRGQFATRDLKGNSGQRRLAIQDPLIVEFDVRHAGSNGETGRSLVADKLIVRSPFLQLAGQGDTSRGQMRCRANGERLTQELEQFFDLRGYSLGGQLDGQVNWQTRQESWRLDGALRGQGLLVQLPGNRTVKEPRVEVQALGVGVFRDWQLQSLETAEIDISIGEDQCGLKLAAPVAAIDESTTWPVLASLTGSMERWSNRVSVIAPASAELRGDVVAQSSASLSPTELVIHELTATLEPFQMISDSILINEPMAKIAARGRYDFANQRLEVPAATFASTAFSLRASELRWPMEASQNAVDPNAVDPNAVDPIVVRVHGDLAKLWNRWRARSTAENQTAGVHYSPSGRADVQLHVQPNTDGSIDFQAMPKVTQFQWRGVDTSNGGRPQVVWSEPVLQVQLRGRYDLSKDQLQLGPSQIATDAVSVDLGGRVAQLSSDMEFDVRGESTIELDRLAQKLRPLLGNDVSVRGRSQHPFHVTGIFDSVQSRQGDPASLQSRSAQTRSRMVSTQSGARSGSTTSRHDGSNSDKSFTAEFGIGWVEAMAFGLRAGPADARVRLTPQQLSMAPLEFGVAGGHISLTPAVQLVEPWWLTVSPGTLARNLELTQPMCQRWMKYVAPLVADATAAQGRLSLGCRELNIPLASPQHARFAGALTLHEGHVGPGPAAHQLLGLIQQIRSLVDPKRGRSEWLDTDKTWIHFPEQAVAVRLENQRVSHNGLTMQIDNVTIRTRGWVDFNQQMSMIAEIPVQDDWVANNRWLSHLQGQSLEIPIRGNVGRANIDGRVIQTLAKQAARGAAEGLIRNELENQLKKLFK